MTPASLLLRPAEEGDAARIAALSIQLGYPATPEAIRERLRLLALQGAAPVRVALVEGEVVGWVQVGRTLSSGGGAAGAPAEPGGGRGLPEPGDRGRAGGRG